MKMPLKDKILRFIAALIIIVLTIWGQKLYKKQSYQVLTFSGLTMGTTYSVKIVSNEDLNTRQIKKEVDALLVGINNEMSTYQADSEISKFNDHLSSLPFKVSPGFYKVVDEAKKIHKASEGLFDPTLSPLINLWGFGHKGKSKQIPTEEELKSVMNDIGMDKISIGKNGLSKNRVNLSLNLSAIAKGYAVDVVAEHVSRYSANVLVEIGGEVFGKGYKDPYKKAAWKIGVEKPNDNGEVGLHKTSELKNQCIASSGDYRNFYKTNGKKYSHVIDPRTGRPMESSVIASSVFAKTCMVADALATTLMVGGKEIVPKLKMGYEFSGFLLMNKDGKLVEFTF